MVVGEDGMEHGSQPRRGVTGRTEAHRGPDRADPGGDEELHVLVVEQLEAHRELRRAGPPRGTSRASGPGAEPVDVLHHRQAVAGARPARCRGSSSTGTGGARTASRAAPALDQVGQPRGDAVDLGGADAADDAPRHLPRSHPPLRVERQADPRVLQRPRPALGDGQEVRHARAAGRAPPAHRCGAPPRCTPARCGAMSWLKSAVGAGDRVGHRDDQLVHRLDPLPLTQRRLGRPPQPAVHLVGSGLAEHAEHPGAGRAVVRHQEPVLAEDPRAAPPGSCGTPAYGGTGG